MTDLTVKKPPTNSQIKVLFISHVDSYFSGFIDFVRQLKGASNFVPVVYFPVPYPNLKKHIEICRSERIDFSVGSKNVQSDRATRGAVFHQLMRLFRFARRLIFAVPLIGYLGHVFVLSRKLRAIRSFLAATNPRLLVLGGDIVGHDMALYIRAGHDLKISSVLLPGWMASAREPAELHYNDRNFRYSRPMNRLLGYVYPQWVYIHRGRRLVRWPAQEALALETLSLAPPKPWVLHSGFADWIAVESEAAFEYGRHEGLPAEKMVITGSSTHDLMHKEIVLGPSAILKLYENYRLDPGRTLVVTALPPDLLYGHGRPECDFKSYQDLVVFWISKLCSAAANLNVLVSLHPSAGAQYNEIIESFGAKVARQPVAELIPHCDVYVASISATIQWAIACGKPVINYDVYRYRYTDYVGLKGVLTIEEQAEYVDLVQRMCVDASFRQEISAFQKVDAPRYGNLDGDAGKRVIRLFESLVLESL